jgi:hypothetical protein
MKISFVRALILFFSEIYMFEILNFGHWDLFGIWDLRFGIYATALRKRK